MRDTDYQGYRTEEENGFVRFGRWLMRRPAENWIFLIAGIVLGNTIL